MQEVGWPARSNAVATTSVVAGRLSVGQASRVKVRYESPRSTAHLVVVEVDDLVGVADQGGHVRAT